jgi:hypothetical protein
MGQRSTDLAAADQRDFVAGHGESLCLGTVP